MLLQPFDHFSGQIGYIYSFVLNGKLYIRQGIINHVPPVQVNFTYEIILQHFGDKQQPFYINAFTVEYPVKRSSCTMYLTGKVNIPHSTFIHLLLNDTPDINVFKTGFHCCTLPCADTSSPVVGVPSNQKREELYTVHQNVVSPNTRLTNELNKHPTLVLYVHNPSGRRYIQPTEASYCFILVCRNFGDFRFRTKRITLSIIIIM